MKWPASAQPGLLLAPPPTTCKRLGRAGCDRRCDGHCRSKCADEVDNRPAVTRIWSTSEVLLTVVVPTAPGSAVRAARAQRRTPTQSWYVR